MTSKKETRTISTLAVLFTTVISWELVYAHYRTVSCSGRAHLSGAFFFFSFRMTTACVAWLQRSTACKSSYSHTHELTGPCAASPPRPIPILPMADCEPPSLLRWGPVLFPHTAPAPPALALGSAAGPTGSDVCQRLPFRSWAWGGRCSDRERLLPSKTWLIPRNRALGEKNVNVRQENVSLERWAALALPWTPPPWMEMPLKNLTFLSFRAHLLFIIKQLLCFLCPQATLAKLIWWRN